MWNQFGLAFFVVLALGLSTSMNSQTPQPTGARSQQSIRVVFVCEHGAALSVVSAAYFNKIAKEEHLNLLAVARGTEPQKEVSVSARMGLKSDGIPFESTHPQRLSTKDAAQARQIVTFCPLPAKYSKLAPVEAWSDVPLPSANYGRARDAILSHLRQLIGRLKSEGTARP
jgi:protein-tyrosine-phosphatase